MTIAKRGIMGAIARTETDLQRDRSVSYYPHCLRRVFQSINGQLASWMKGNKTKKTAVSAISETWNYVYSHIYIYLYIIIYV